MKYLPEIIVINPPKRFGLHLLNDCGNMYQQAVFV